MLTTNITNKLGHPGGLDTISELRIGCRGEHMFVNMVSTYICILCGFVIYIYTYIHIHTYMYTYTYVYTYVLYTYIYVCMDMYVCVCVYIYIYIHIYILICYQCGSMSRSNLLISAGTTCVSYIYIYIYMYIYIYRERGIYNTNTKWRTMRQINLAVLDRQCRRKRVRPYQAGSVGQVMPPN